VEIERVLTDTESRSQKRYVPTEKECEHLSFTAQGDKDYVYYHIAGRIRDEFGEIGATPREVYQQITGPLGISQRDTIVVLRAAKREGYLS